MVIFIRLPLAEIKLVVCLADWTSYENLVLVVWGLVFFPNPDFGFGAAIIALYC
jgi:hypothetical protein